MHDHRQPGLRFSVPVPSRRTTLLFAMACLAFPAAPLLLGDGVDLPDDALYHSIASWEWLRFCTVEGVSPWFIPGKLGGSSLFADVIPMGPFYPAAALLLFLPTWAALPLAFFAHSLGALLSVRWMARAFQVPAIPATVAGAAVALGPIGVLHYVDFWADSLALLVWFPLAVGAHERMQGAPTRRRRAGWAILVAAALALLMLGCHVRISAAAVATFGLWVLIRRAHLRWGLASMVLGMAAGSPGFLPYVMEASLQLPGGTRLQTLSGPAHAALDPWNLAGFLAPKPLSMDPDFGLGAVLGFTLLLSIRGLTGPTRRLGWLALALLTASLVSNVHGVRWLFSPLLLLTHPVNDIYTGLGFLCAAAPAAHGLERLARGGRDYLVSQLRSPAGALLGLFVVGLIVRTGAGAHVFPSTHQWHLALQSALLAVVVLALILWIGSRRRHSYHVRMSLMFALALLELVILSVQFHIAVPSHRLAYREPIAPSDVSLVSQGYLDITDLADLQGFLYTPEEEMAFSDQDVIEELGPGWGSDLLDRRWPITTAPRHGLRAVAGRAKMPSDRVVGLLMPLARALRTEDEDLIRWEDVDPARLAAVFEPSDGIGTRTMVLFGIGTAVGRNDVVASVDDVAPPCYVPASLEHPGGPRESLPDTILSRRFRADGPSIVESTPPLAEPTRPDLLTCADTRHIAVDTSGPTVVVVRLPIHPGWEIRDQDGTRLDPFPVNMIHMGVLLPEGDHALSLRFRPPGLVHSLAVAGIAWSILALAGLSILMTRGTGRRTGARTT
jgi:hypothetical protein